MRNRLTSPSVIIVMLGAFATLTLVSWFARVHLPTSADYGPLQTSLFTARIAAGFPFYRDFREPPWSPMPYGPIAPWLASHLSRAFGTGVGAALAAGRAIMIVATLAVCLMIFALAKLNKATTASAVVVALAFMLSPTVRFQAAEYRVDLLALAFNFCGLLLFELSFSLPAAVLFVAAFFTKQGQFYGIAAVLLTLCAACEFRRALTIGAAWIVLLGGLITALVVAFPWYWLNAFGAVTPILDLTAPFNFGANELLNNAAIFGLAAVTLLRSRWNLIHWLFVAALLENSASCLRWGSGSYYFFPTIAAAALLSASTLDTIFEWAAGLSRMWQIGFGLLVALVLCSGALFRAVHTRLKLDLALVPSIPASTTLNPSILKRLHGMDGPIVTTVPLYSIRDRRRNVYWMELLTLNGMKVHGTFDDRPLLDSIRRHEIAAFVMDSKGLNRAYRGRKVYWPKFHDAIEDNYRRLPGTGPMVVMVPKSD
jgi:hypothetical protein